jgi:hypothetical protein
MQTFLPYADFRKSLEVLDYRRLGKQRVEAMQLIKAIEQVPTLDGKPYKGWVNHPATKMWRSYPDALKLYCNIAIEVWVERGYKNTMSKYDVPENVELPWWLGNQEIHTSHQSNLYHKSPHDYPQFEMEFIPYVWPI